MLELLNEKLELIKAIKKITEDIICISIEEDAKKFDELIEKRQELIDEIEKINPSILEYKGEEDGFSENIKKDINLNLQSIIEMDKKIKLIAQDTIRKVKNEFYEVEKRIETSNYSLEEEDKKPSGYFLNRKG